MDTQEQPPDAEPVARRGRTCWLSLLLILLMLFTVLACGSLFLYTLSHRPM